MKQIKVLNSTNQHKIQKKEISINLQLNPQTDLKEKSQQKNEETLEEGEIQIYDKNHYINSEGELFRFKTYRETQINWRQIQDFDQEYQEQNNLIQSYEEFRFGVPEKEHKEETHTDISSHILLNLESIAFCDFENTRNARWLSKESKQVMKIIQLTMQYYMFAQKHLTNKVLTLNTYLQAQMNQLQQMKSISQKQKNKIRKQRHLSNLLNDQAIHYEILMHRMKPNILKNRMANLELLQKRKDVRLVSEQEDKNVVSSILQEQGILQEGESTIIYEKVAYPNQKQAAKQQSEEQKSNQIAMQMILQEIKSMKDQLQNMQLAQVEKQSPLLNQQAKQVSFQNKEDQGQKKYQSPAREMKNSEMKLEDRIKMQEKKGNLQFDESIVSDESGSLAPSAINNKVKIANESTSNLAQSLPEQIHQSLNSNKNEESAKSVVTNVRSKDQSNDGPKMRRVKNPYGQEQQQSIKSNSSSLTLNQQRSQKDGGSKRKIEIEKVSDNDSDENEISQNSLGWQHKSRMEGKSQKIAMSQATDDSYQEDEFEEVSQTLSGNFKIQGQSQINDKIEKQNRQFINNRQSINKLRQAHGKKDATPIKEEDIEEEFTDFEENNQANKKVQKKPQNNERKNSEVSHNRQKSYERKNSRASTDGGEGGNFDRDSRQDDLEEDFLKIEDQSRSRTNSVPLTVSSNSGNYQHAFIEKARNINSKGQVNVQSNVQQISQDIKKTIELDSSDSYQAKGFSQIKKSKTDKKQDEEFEDEYIDDDFLIEEDEDSQNQISNSIHTAQNVQKDFHSNPNSKLNKYGKHGSEIDFNISASGSMLPPLAGGAQTKHYGADALMQNFNVNLADSASLDYDLSGSGFGPQNNQKRQLTIQAGNNSNKQLQNKDSGDDGSQSMDSHDFAVSESNFSMSKQSMSFNKAQQISQQRNRSHTSAIKNKDKKQVKEFYAADYGKLTSFIKTEDTDQIPLEEQFD